MIKISKQQIAERWDSLPDELLDALVSEANSDFIWKVSEEENLPEEKIKLVAMVTGHVLMGFIHPEDVARELKTVPGIDPKTATTLETALIQRIFAPLRQQIDAVYAPLSKFEVEPNVILEISPTAVPVPSPSGPQILSESFAAQPNATLKPVPAPPPRPAVVPTKAVAPKPVAVASSATTSSPGWSRRAQQDPVVKLGVITPGMPKTPSTAVAASTAPAPKPATVPVPSSVSTSAQKPKTISEFDRLDLQNKKVTSPPMVGVKAPTQIPPPPPVMLHEVGAPRTEQKDQHFQVHTGMQNQMGDPSIMRPPAPPKPAVIEFGMPQPATPPKPGTPPTPPVPPPANKVIVQDFLKNP